jgi:hypothetical protein
MALPSSSSPPPVTIDQFVADRQSIWGSFVNATTGTVVVMVLLLAAMAIFLL